MGKKAVKSQHDEPRRSGRPRLPRLSSNQHAVYVDDGDGNLKLAGIKTYDGQAVPVPDENNAALEDPVVEKPKTAKKNPSTTAKKSKDMPHTPATAFKVPKAKPLKKGTTAKKTAAKTAKPESTHKVGQTVILSKNSRPQTRQKAKDDKREENAEKMVKKATTGTAAKGTAAGSNTQTGTKRGRPPKTVAVTETADQAEPKDIPKTTEKLPSNVSVTEPPVTAVNEAADQNTGPGVTAKKRGRPPKKVKVLPTVAVAETAQKSVRKETKSTTVTTAKLPGNDPQGTAVAGPSAQNDAPNVTGKKRGRPKGTAVKGPSVQNDAPNVPGKKRGKPPKEKSTITESTHQGKATAHSEKKRKHDGTFAANDNAHELMVAVPEEAVPETAGVVTEKPDATAPEDVNAVPEKPPSSKHSVPTVKKAVVKPRPAPKEKHQEKEHETGKADQVVNVAENNRVRSESPERSVSPELHRTRKHDDGPRGWETKKPTAREKRGREEVPVEEPDLPGTMRDLSFPYSNMVHEEEWESAAMAAAAEPRPAKVLARTDLRTMVKDAHRSRIVKKKSSDTDNERLINANSHREPAPLETRPGTSKVFFEHPKLDDRFTRQAPHAETTSHAHKHKHKPDAFHMRKRQKITPERFVETDDEPVENDNQHVDLASVSFAVNDDIAEGYQNEMGEYTTDAEAVRYAKLIKMPAAESGRFHIKAGVRKGGGHNSPDVTLMMFVHAGRARIHRSEILGEHSYFTVKVGGVASVAPGRWYDVEARGSQDLDLFFVRVYNRNV